MTYTVLVEGDQPHVHTLPGYNGEGTDDHHHVPDTVVRCNGCQRLFVWACGRTREDHRDGWWCWEPLSSWRPRHRRARRLLAESIRGGVETASRKSP